MTEEYHAFQISLTKPIMEWDWFGDGQILLQLVHKPSRLARWFLSLILGSTWKDLPKEKE